MSTPSEHLEATVWLESTYPDIPPRLRTEFVTAVDAYYAEHPITGRCPDTIEILHQDDRAFTEILRVLLNEQYTTGGVAFPPDAH